MSREEIDHRENPPVCLAGGAGTGVLQTSTLAGALRIELRPSDLESPVLTATQHPNIMAQG